MFMGSQHQLSFRLEKPNSTPLQVTAPYEIVTSQSPDIFKYLDYLVWGKDAAFPEPRRKLR
jgi:hypothetical protein